MTDYKKGLLFVNVSTLLMSGAGLFAKAIPWPAPTIIFGRMLVAGLTLFLYLSLRRSIRIDVADRTLLVVQGVLLVIHWVTFFMAIQFSTVAIGVVSVSTITIFATFLEPLFHRQRLLLLDVLVAITSVIGVMVMIEEFSITDSTFQGVTLGLLSALARAMQIIMSRSHVQKYTGPVVMMWQLLIGAVVLIPVLTFFPVSPTSADIVKLLALAVIATAVAHTMFLSSLHYISARIASIMGNINPVYAILLAVVLLGEVPSTRTIGGAVIIIGSICVETMQKKNT